MKKICSLIVLNALLWMNLGFFGVQNTFAAVNTAPVITSPEFVEVEENTTSVMTVTATDSDEPAQELFFYISQIFGFGGADDVEFLINETTGELSFSDAPDFENPTQSGITSNEYEVVVGVDDDNGGFDEVTIIVTVTDIDENIIVSEPEIISHIDGQIINTFSPLIEGTGYPDGEIVIRNSDSTSFWFGDVEAGGNFQLAIVLDEGSNVLFVSTIDADGNESEEISIELIVDVESVSGEIVILSHEDGDSVNTTNVVLEGIGSPNSTFELSNFTTGVDILSNSTDDEGNFSVELALVEGINEMYMYTLDADYQNNGELFFDLFVDTEEIVILSHEDGDSVNTTNVVLEGIGSPNSTFELSNFTTGVDILSNSTDDEGNFSVELALVEGINEMYMYTLDADYQNNGELFFDLFVDTGEIVILSHEDGDSVTTTNVVLEGIGSPNSTFELSNFTTGVDILSNSTDDEGNFSVELALVEGINEMYMYTLDADYQNNGELFFDLFVDTEAPIITFADDVESEAVYSDTVIIDFDDNNTDPEYDIYQFYTFVDTEICNENTYENSGELYHSYIKGDEIIFDTEEFNGKYVCIEVEDTADNITYGVSANPINIDLSLPSPYDIVITSPSENEVVGTTTPTIIGTAFADSYVEIEDGFYNLIGSGYADENGDFSVILTTSLEEGNNTILVYPSLDLEDGESFLPSDYPYIEGEEDEVAFIVDTTHAVISLIGEESIIIEHGDEYIDEGAEYMDSVDGTGSVEGVGTVDTSTLGEYEITYNYTDTAGNISEEVIRTVNVVDTTAPVITVVGENIVDTEYGEEYVDAGAEYNDNVDLTGSVVGEGEVDVNTLGGFTLTYDYADTSGNVGSTSSRLVNVVDTTAAVITINGESSIEIEYGESYGDEGAEYSDSVDGTGSLVGEGGVDTSTLGEYEITYNYTDEAGNVSEEVVRTVNVVDTTKPVLTLVGNDSITISEGSTYSDAGATYIDNVDGNGSVVGVHNVDTSTVGEYTVTYNYTDTAGNIAEEIERTVTVAVVTRSSGGGGGGSYTSTCKIETHLECKQNISGVYVYFKKSGKSCRGGSLGKACDSSTTVVEYQTTTGDSELAVSKKTELEKQEAALLETKKGANYKTRLADITEKLSDTKKEIVIQRIDAIDLENERFAKYKTLLLYFRALLEYNLLQK